jgi:hypothetical protein
MQDSPGLEIGDGLFDDVPNSVDFGVEICSHPGVFDGQVSR